MKTVGVLAMLSASALSACARTEQGPSVDARVQPSTTIVQGRVLGAGDSALGGARVSATLLAPASRLPTPQRYEVTTNSAGRYQLELPPAEYLVQVIHRGRAPQRQVVRLSPRQQLQQDWRLVPSGSVSGKVLGPGAAASGAHVTLVMLDTHDLPASPPRTAVASAEGHFRFEDVPPGVASLTVRGAGFFSETSGIVNVAPGQETRDVALPARTAYVIRGTLIPAADPQRRVGDTPVTALNLATGESFESTQPAQGAAFEIVDVPPGHYALQSGVPGAPVSDPVVVRIDASDLVDQKVPATPTFRISGRLQPGIEASITVSQPGVTPDLPPLVVATEHIPKGTTNFSIQGIPEGDAVLTAAGRGGWRARQVVKVRRDLDDVVVGLTQTPPIRGRVADAQGDSVPGLTVVAVPQRDPLHFDERDTASIGRDVTGPDGSFSISGVSARSVTLQVQDSFGRLLAGGASAPLQTVVDTLALSDVPVESNLTVSSCGEKVRGCVRDLAGRPVPLASVRLAAPRDQRDERYVQVPTHVLTGPDGRFEFSGLCQKRYELSASDAARTASSAARYTSGSEADSELTLLPRRRVKLSVRHQEQPVTEFGVEFYGKTESRFPVRSQEGHFLSPPLDTGMLRIVVVASDGYVDRHLRVTEREAVTSADLHLQPWSMVQGRVVDASGRPVTAAWVAVSIRPPGVSGTAPELAVSHLSAHVRTDGAGRFQVRRLMQGKLFLRIAKAGRLLTLRRARVETSAEPLIGRGTTTSESLGEGQTLDLGDLELYPAAAGND